MVRWIAVGDWSWSWVWEPERVGLTGEGGQENARMGGKEDGHEMEVLCMG